MYGKPTSSSTRNGIKDTTSRYRHIIEKKNLLNVPKYTTQMLKVWRIWQQQLQQHIILCYLYNIEYSSFLLINHEDKTLKRHFLKYLFVFILINHEENKYQKVISHSFKINRPFTQHKVQDAKVSSCWVMQHHQLRILNIIICVQFTNAVNKKFTIFYISQTSTQIFIWVWFI